MKLQTGKRTPEGSGFALIEVVAFIVIVGALAAIIAFAVGSLNNTSAASACQADVKRVEAAVQSYYDTNGRYPTAQSQLVGSYLRQWPNNPNYYTLSLAASGQTEAEVDVTLAPGDPGSQEKGAQMGAYNADSRSAYGSGSIFSGQTICAGA